MRTVELVVAADEPALFFSSIEAAERSLEAIDVRNGVYTAAYGPNGEPFSIEAVGERVRFRRLSGADQPNELAELMRSFFSALGVIPEPDITGMLEQARKYIDD